MTRLFFRFYVGVVVILIVAWLVQTGIADLPSTQNVAVVENALAGGVRLARNQVADIWHKEESVSAFKYRQIAGNFEYPMNLISFKDADWLVDPDRQRLLDGEVVLLGDRISIAIFPPPKTESSLAEDILVPNGTSKATAGQINKSTRASEEKAEPKYFLLFGPLPQFVGPSRSQVTLRLNPSLF